MGNSAQFAQIGAARKGAFEFLRPHLDICILLLLVVWLYHSVLYRLVIQWATDHDSSHGFFVPAFAAFVVWQNRSRLKNIPTSPSWAGFPVVIFAVAMLVLGVLGVELFTERTSLLVLLAGLIILSRGWSLFRALLFPWAFLFLMIPLPKIILQEFTFPLQLFASSLATWLLRAVGIPVYQEGNVINLPHFPGLEVAEACSGLRSLVSLVTLAIIYGCLLENRKWVRVTLACAAVPIALAANIFRISVTGLVGEWNPELAEGFYHEFQGWLVFIVSLLLLFATHRIIDWIWGPAPRNDSRQCQLAPDAVSSASAPARSRGIRFLVAALVLLITAVFLQAQSQTELLPHREPLNSLPLQIDNWTGSDDPLNQQTLEVLGHGDFLNREYVDASGQAPSVDLFVAYYPSQRFGDTIHTPKNCIFGAGWVPIRKERVPLTGTDGAFMVNRLVVEKAGEKTLVLYWFQANSRKVASEYEAKYDLIVDSIRLHRSDGALIRLSSLMDKGESPDAAQDRIMKLGKQILPLLDKSIPR